MKYMRKTPVEAIQWNGDNLNEVYDFIIKTAKSCCVKDDYSDLIIAYEDRRGRKFKTVIPLFGWVVREGNTFQFYRDTTFIKTFEEVREGIDWEGMNKTVKEAFDSFDEAFEDFKDIFGTEPNKETLDLINRNAHTRNAIRSAKMTIDLCKDDERTREQVKKTLSDGLKEMAGSDTHKATFESVLDEMKELHAKKDKDYGSAFHKSFEEFGVTAGVVRLNDKMERVKSLVKNGKAEIKDESLLDSLEDLACYAVMLYVELKNKDNGKL